MKVRRCCDWHWYLSEFVNAGAEREMRRCWVDAVKRRLGLIEPGDDKPRRLAQWEDDRASEAEAAEGWTAVCAKGRELDTALTLELADERVREVRGHPWLQGSDAFLFKAPEPFMFMPDPVPWPSEIFRTIRCPGCTATIYPSLGFDQSGHYSFCSIAYPPMRPMGISVVLGGL